MAILTVQDVAQGLRNSEFFLYYQPKASLITNSLVGAEALARWRLPDGTVLSPSAFIALAEQGNMIKALTLQLWPKLVHDLADRGKGRDLQMSFNVTAADFEDDTLTLSILDAICKGQLQPGWLELEITETQALQAGANVLLRIRALTEAGVGLAMDDYGVGYSSMDTLSRWPFTTIKLDQGIVGRMLTSSKNATIVRSSIRLGHELGLKVVAEGVESIEQHDFLVEAGCKLVQGYLVSPPLPLDEFESFRQHTRPAHGMPIGLVHMAIVDHIQWRRQMVSYAIQRTALPPDSPTRKLGGHPQLCITRCALGQWYYGVGCCFAHMQTYQDLAEPHYRLHAVGERIVDGVQSGASQTDIGPLLQEMKQASAELIALLQDIEDAGLASLYGSAGAGAHEKRIGCSHAPSV